MIYFIHLFIKGRIELYLIMKRFFDILISFFALILLIPLFFLIAVTIKIDSNGSVFFSQKRLGKNGNIFNMLKFRSMVMNAENIGTGLFNYADDPRVTKIGRILRNTSLDELPQLVNVLKGDMSIIGPRPAVVYELGDYNTLNACYKKRFKVLPGITGLAQISGRNEIPWEQKIVFDNTYVDLLQKKGIQTDIKIMLKTIFVICTASDIYEHKVKSEITDEESAERATKEVIRKAHE